ncbi:hypothetical protein Naga_101258g1 [Nannochloropsis gaditana]|uniref:Uncharacterized protein n=1 Tax=Nannochloropsis gaditana TaxID=72520 RepID=W7U692_9STRA|nr:hypothetical protein Naga_101258g1 [Nannochloropsis gaditana]
MTAQRIFVPIFLCLASASAFFMAPPRSILKAGEVVSLPDHLFSSSLTEQQAGRSKGVLFSLVINPKRQGITQLGVEEIKARKAALLRTCRGLSWSRGLWRRRCSRSSTTSGCGHASRPLPRMRFRPASG